ncbi:AraC family transcriptional regulator [Paenibacillaceae bacterium]|nr:AraC family transcriptional regulator [Paenibacillaceae bacterium]
MNHEQRTFWKKYAAKAQLELMFAAYTKVGKEWGDSKFVPDYNRFYFITEGEGFVAVGDKRYYPQPGQLYLLPAGVQQSYGTISSHTFGKYWCHFTATVGDLPLFKLLETPLSVNVADPDALIGKFKELIHYAHLDSLSGQFRVNALLFELIALFLEESDNVRWNMSASASFEKMSAVLQYIETHLADNVSIDTLAQIAHFHPNYFINVFKHFTGYSPIQYINRIRLEKAKHMITTTDRSVSLIAETVGMDLPYFSRAFKEYTGFAPTVYRDMVSRPDGSDSDGLP